MKRRPRVTRQPLASALSPESLRLIVMQRLSRARCLECGGQRCGGAEFCPSCLRRFPLTHDLGPEGSVLALDGWAYVVVQRGPEIPEFGHFDALRFGVFERDGKSLPIATHFCTFEAARKAALAAYSRSLRALGWAA